MNNKHALLALHRILYSRDYCATILFSYRTHDMSLSLTPEAAILQGMGAGVVPVAVTEAANRAVVYIDTRYTHTQFHLASVAHLYRGRMCMCSLWAGTNCLNSEETTLLRRKATWEKGPTTEPQTRELCSNVPQHISGNVGQRSMADSVAHMAEIPR